MKSWLTSRSAVICGLTIAAVLLPIATVLVAAAHPVASEELPASADPAPDGTQPPLRREILPPTNCETCHAAYDDENHIEPHDSWSGSMMANSSRDPVFWAALDVANNDIPGVGEFCLRCHASVGWLGGRAEADSSGEFLAVGDADGCSLEGNIDEDFADFAGVNCHQCHRAMVNENPPAGQQSLYTENAKFWLDDGTCGGFGEPCRRGPYNYGEDLDADGQVSMPAPHANAYSALHEDSEFCGQCHNVTNPVKTLIDENGNDTGIPYPVERTLLEWQNSDFGSPNNPSYQTCQNCHMPDARANPAYASNLVLNNWSGRMPIHQFAGGNVWIPQLLKNEYDMGRDEAYDITSEWARAILESAATLEVTAPFQAGPGDEMLVRVKVTNESGHKLPTGYFEGRRMWINLKVIDGTGKTLYESGAYDPETAVLDGGTFGVESDTKLYWNVRGIYDEESGECETEDEQGREMFHFVLNDCYVFDNRIPPKGFTGGDNIEIQPFGYVYPETTKGSGKLVNFDVTTYDVQLPANAQGPFRVEARLYYQSSSKEYIEFLYDQAIEHDFPDDCVQRATVAQPQMSRGEILHDMWERNGKSEPVLMTSDTAVVGETGGTCTPNGETLCLSDGRFAVTANFSSSGGEGAAKAEALTGDTGYFWFFDEDNVEVIIKTLDTCRSFDRFWVFAAGLTNVSVDIQVTDTVANVTKTYSNPQNTPFQPIQDTDAFATCDASASRPPTESVNVATALTEWYHLLDDAGLDGERRKRTFNLSGSRVCANDDATLCVADGRFEVTAEWMDRNGNGDVANAVRLTDDTGYFWFFDDDNVELVVKVLGGCNLNGNYWVFAGGLTNVQVDITVEDTEANVTRIYQNPQGTSFQPIQDTGAFATCP